MELKDLKEQKERKNSGSVTDFSLFGSNQAIPMTPFSQPLTPEFTVSEIEKPQVWPKRFACNFIEPGLVRYKGEDGKPDDMVLVTEEALERMAKSFIGKPVVDWDHAEVWPAMIAEGKADGIVSDVWKGEDGWWHCSFEVWDAEAIRHCESGDWFVSCAYIPTEIDKKGGKHHSIPYTEEVLDGEYTHLALVKNPRYENARIRANSKTEEGGGYKMAFKWLSNKPSALRLNADKGEEKVLVDVDGNPVEAKELFAALEEQEREEKVLHGNDDDEIEFEGKKAKLGDLKKAFKNKLKKNAEKLKEKKVEDEELENLEKKAKKNEAAGHREDQVPQGGAAEDNLDVGVSAAQELSLKSKKEIEERLQSLQREIMALKNSKSDELRNAAEGNISLGEVPMKNQIMTIQERIATGKAKMSAISAATSGPKA
jgi:uncharacterized small protein (DUF1192 family)